MADSIAESARKASAGTWRKPRVRIYDYNQDIGSNYYQPMIKYINDKEVFGPYMEKKSIEMPERAEIGSNKYSNMRYDDKSNANLDLDDFLVKAYAKQIKELNSSTASAHYQQIHNSKLPTFYTKNDLLGHYVRANGAKTKYLNELSHVRQRETREEERRAFEAQYLAEMAERQNTGPTAEEIEELENEFIKDARARMFWIYKPRNVKELKQWLE